MYIHSNAEIDKRINVSKIANNISTLGDNSTAAGCNSRLITVLVHNVLTFIKVCTISLLYSATAFKHLTIEFCTVVMLLTFILIIINISSPHHSFIPGLKPPFSANPSHCSLPCLFPDWLHGFPGLFTDTSEHIRFYCLVSLFSTFRLVVIIINLLSSV